MSKLQALMEAQRKAKEELNNVGRPDSSDGNQPNGPIAGQSESTGDRHVQLPVVPAKAATGFKPNIAAGDNPPSTSGFKPKSGVATTVDAGSGVASSPQLPTRTGITSSSRDASRNVLSLDDLDALALDEELDEPSGVAGYLYIDREKVIAPDREYEFELDESQQGFVNLLDGIYEVLNDPQAFGAMIRTIMLELQENGEYRKLLADSDVNAMMRGLRDSMGMARIKKTEKTKGRSSAPTSKRQNQVLESLDGLGFDASDLDD